MTNSTKNSVIRFPFARGIQEASRQQPVSGVPGQVIDLDANRRLARTASKSVHAPLSASEIWDAINNDKIVVHYQPQYEVSSNETVAAEALVRLGDSNELIMPDRFIELCEQSDLIIPLGRKVIEHVCRSMAQCRAAGYPLRHIAINVSAHQLNIDHGLMDFIEQQIDINGLQYSDLEFELTERQNLLSDGFGAEVLRALAGMGSRVVLDDFGMGYSSMLYLSELPIAAFKLDRALVSGLMDDERRQVMVKALLSLGHELGVDVIAEGVETQAQHEFLVSHKCALAQGFGFSRPIDMLTLTSLLDHEESIREAHGSIATAK